jgi:hypothetical protein
MVAGGHLNSPQGPLFLRKGALRWASVSTIAHRFDHLCFHHSSALLDQFQGLVLIPSNCPPARRSTKVA